MPKKYVIVPLILSVIFIVLAIVTLPGFFNYFYQLGRGHAFREIVKTENLLWDTMTATERAPYMARSETEGLKCALLMTLGQHVPIYLFVLIIIGLLIPSITRRFKIFLWFSVISVWILGMVCLSIGVGYYGQAHPFPESLGPALLIYFAAAICFGIVLGIGKLIQRISRKPMVQPPPTTET